MRLGILRSTAICLSLSTLTTCSVKAYAQGPTWEQQLREQVPVASIGNNGMVIRPGVLVTIAKDGITALPVAPPLAPGMAWPNTYKKGGRVGTPALQRLNYSPVQQYSRALQVGERAYIYSIQLKSSEVVLSLQTAPSTQTEGLYRATIAFQFQKGEMQTIDLNSVEAYIGEVLQIDTAVGTQAKPTAVAAVQYTPPPPPPTPAVRLSLPARFVNAQAATDQLELNRDGTFKLQEQGETYTGTFTQSGNTIELSIAETKGKSTASFDGTKLVDDSGETWLIQPTAQ